MSLCDFTHQNNLHVKDQRHGVMSINIIMAHWFLGNILHLLVPFHPSPTKVTSRSKLWSFVRSALLENTVDLFIWLNSGLKVQDIILPINKNMSLHFLWYFHNGSFSSFVAKILLISILQIVKYKEQGVDTESIQTQPFPKGKIIDNGCPYLRADWKDHNKVPRSIIP